MEQEAKPLTNTDILASQGLVEIYDATISAYRQVPKAEAEKMIANLEKVKAAMEGDKSMNNLRQVLNDFLTKLAAIKKTDRGSGNDGIGVTRQVGIHDACLRVRRKWTITKAVFDEAVREQAEAFLQAGGDMQEALQRFNGKLISQDAFSGNLLLNEGINELWTLVAGGGGTAYSNANAELGVGGLNAAEAATQTDLQAATNKLFEAMDGGYPTYGTNQKITFRATFGSSEANFSWQEFSVRNGNSANRNLNRKISNQGTKTSGQTWQVTLEITLS